MTEPRIRPLAGPDEAAHCARMMISTDPWITLGRSFEAALAAVLDPTREVHVHEANGVIDGVIILSLTGAFTGYIQTICVAPEARSRGIGRQLIAFAEDRIRDVAPTVFLTVSSFNPRARALYERLGYQVVGELPDYIVEGHSETLMWKRRMPWGEFVPAADRRAAPED